MHTAIKILIVWLIMASIIYAGLRAAQKQAALMKEQNYKSKTKDPLKKIKTY